MSKGAMLQKLIDQANKKYGDGTIIRGGEYPVLQRMSTGVFALDVEIGGGVPKGRIVIFTGKSTGKTSIAAPDKPFQRTCRNHKPLVETRTGRSVVMTRSAQGVFVV